MWSDKSEMFLGNDASKCAFAESVTVPSEDWVLGNTHQDGFYRVNYDEDNWALLIALLQTDHLVSFVSSCG